MYIIIYYSLASNAFTIQLQVQFKSRCNINIHIIHREEDYPYTSGDTGETGDCKYDAESQVAAVYVRGYETLPHNNYTAVINHIANVGPLGISADASVWHSYQGGVFDGCPYEENININHGIQVTYVFYIKPPAIF